MWNDIWSFLRDKNIPKVNPNKSTLVIVILRSIARTWVNYVWREQGLTTTREVSTIKVELLDGVKTWHWLYLFLVSTDDDDVIEK